MQRSPGSSNGATVQPATAEGAPRTDRARKLTLVDPATNTAVELPTAAAPLPSRGAATPTPQPDPWLINLSDSSGAKSVGETSPNGMAEVTSQLHPQHIPEALLDPEGGGGDGLTADKSQPTGCLPLHLAGVELNSSAAADSLVEAKSSDSLGAVKALPIRPSAESPSVLLAGRSAAGALPRPEVQTCMAVDTLDCHREKLHADMFAEATGVVEPNHIFVARALLTTI